MGRPRLCLRINQSTRKGLENQFLFHNNSSKGLENLQLSAQGKYDKGTHICCLSLLCNGNLKHGKQFLDTLEWERTLTTSKSCWRKIKKSTQ
ncbi:hypothetical protein Bca4012_056082 [Brassica carinata]|uniref:Uncharacterized protein n=1 Tax=Brassica carinata TaxID=52824 RepID=A0A8X7VZI4_BRACI|nr:hypothetical protein Bca52824_014107 [Brassica carinata]